MAPQLLAFVFLPALGERRLHAIPRTSLVGGHAPKAALGHPAPNSMNTEPRRGDGRSGRCRHEPEAIEDVHLVVACAA